MLEQMLIDSMASQRIEIESLFREQSSSMEKFIDDSMTSHRLWSADSHHRLHKSFEQTVRTAGVGTPASPRAHRPELQHSATSLLNSLPNPQLQRSGSGDTGNKFHRTPRE